MLKEYLKTGANAERDAMIAVINNTVIVKKVGLTLPALFEPTSDFAEGSLFVGAEGLKLGGPPTPAVEASFNLLLPVSFGPFTVQEFGASGKVLYDLDTNKVKYVPSVGIEVNRR
jgi:hypothetical protein